MKKAYELHYTQLKNGCSPETFSFQTTAELEPLEGIIGQDRAVRAFDFGLAVKMKGYNIYMSGPSGTGKTTYARRSTEALAATEPVPMDWCYVYNFRKPKEPIALPFAAGTGRQFREDMAKLVTIFRRELTKAFRSEDYEKQKLALIHDYEQRQNELLDRMTETGAEYGFNVNRTEEGVFFVPVVNGELLEDDGFEALPEEVQSKIEANSLILQEKAAQLLRQVQDLEKECETQVSELDRKIGMDVVGEPVAALVERY